MELVLPSVGYADAFLDGQRELARVGEETDPHTAESVLSLLERYAKDRAGDVAPDRVPQDELWYVDSVHWIGRVGIRHRLNERLERFGGHVGYLVRPSRRREGHASWMLALALPRAHALGLSRVLVTCDEDNVGSRRTIEKNGGVLEDVIDYEGAHRMRFWIRTSPDFRPVV